MTNYILYHTKADIDVFISKYGLEALLNDQIPEHCSPEAKAYLELKKPKTNGHSTEQEVAAAKAAPVTTTTAVIEQPAPNADASSQAKQPPAVAEEEVPEVSAGTGPLTEQEVAETVKSWAMDDSELESSDHMKLEDMVEIFEGMKKHRGSEIPVSRFKEIISEHYVVPVSSATATKSSSDCPKELLPLVESGVARLEGKDWLVNRCNSCGQFKNECCGQIRAVLAAQRDGTLTSYGRQAAGLEPIKKPSPPQSDEQILQKKMADIQKEPAWNQFRGVNELEGDGTVKMYIENFLPEGATLICGLPKEGKSFLALSVAKALTTGKPLFGKRGFEVPEIVPVLYLAAESGDGALKVRCKKFFITEDKTRFLARTLTQGVMFGLNSPEIETVVKALRPAIILETLIRFNDGDEDNASENNKLAAAIFHLIALGARVVIGIHHSRKDVKSNPTKEAAVRGSGDGLAMVDAIWLVLQDERLLQGGKGPNEIELIGWGRDFQPAPMRLALTKKAKSLPGVSLYAPGIVSCIDSGDFEWVDRQDQRRELSQVVEELITKEPSISREKLVEETGATEWEVKATLKKLGYSRPKGGKQGAGPWVKKQTVVE